MKASEPAFPMVQDSASKAPDCPGLSIREYFAARAMQGMLNGAMGQFGPDVIKIDALAKASLKCADALIEALNK